MSSCCLNGFRWEAQPQGRETTIDGLKCYVTGSNSDVAILVIHDLYGWTFGNTRVLADHYAEEVGATVYLPDFFGGEALPADVMNDPPSWPKLPEFIQRNSKEIREPEITSFARHLRTQHGRTGAIGFCFGGWGVFRLGSKSQDPVLVDCISTAHPSFLTKEEMLAVDVPVQIMAPEIDPMFTEKLKNFAVTEIPKLGVPFDYAFFPGLSHGFSIRGNQEDDKEMRGMERAKRAAVMWFKEWLKGEQ